MDENKGKILIAGSLLLLVLAGVILFLFVLPGLNGTGQSLAQGGPSAGGPGGPSGPGGPPPTSSGGPGGPSGPGGPPAGGPGGPSGPGGPPVGGPGGPGGAMGGPGGPGGAMGATTAPAAPIVPVPALEASRPNPFLPAGTEGGVSGAPAKVPYATKYGVNWSQLPITARLGFVRPNVPARAVVQPPTPTEEPSFDITVTSILWTQDGQAMAVYESGPKSGVVRPGDVVGEWQVLEIWRDRIIVADRKNGKTQTVYLTSKAPAAARPSGGGATPSTGGGRPGRRQGVPAGGMPPAPGMPPPVR